LGCLLKVKVIPIDASMLGGICSSAVTNSYHSLVLAFVVFDIGGEMCVLLVDNLPSRNSLFVCWVVSVVSVFYWEV